MMIHANNATKEKKQGHSRFASWMALSKSHHTDLYGEIDKRLIQLSYETDEKNKLLWNF